MGRQITLYAINHQNLEGALPRMRKILRRINQDVHLADKLHAIDSLPQTDATTLFDVLILLSATKKQNAVVEIGETPTKETSARFMELLICNCPERVSPYDDAYYYFPSPKVLDRFLRELAKDPGIYCYFRFPHESDVDGYLVFDSH